MSLSKKSKEYRKINHLCPVCGQPNVGDKSLCQKHLDRVNISKHILRKSRIDQGLCVTCGKISVYKKQNCEKCIEKINKWYNNSSTKEKQKAIRIEYRKTVVEHYGDKCVCCGENNPYFLAIDHINGDGGKHKQQLRKSGSTYYKWIIDHNFPSDLQILCHNCNMGRYLNGGVCPHEQI